MSKIPYADETWPVVTGCSKVSLGCARCWAAAISHRFKTTTLPWTPENAAENVVLHPENLDRPLHWRRPRTVFVCATSDLFHEQVPDEFISHVFAVMAMAPRHRFLLLTKRAERMHQYLTEMAGNPEAYVWAWAREASDIFLDGAPAPSATEVWPLPNVWLGVSCENQRMADERIPKLLDTPAAHRWASLEPLLGPVELETAFIDPHAATYHNRLGVCVCNKDQRLDVVVVGGESGSGYRALEHSWVYDIRDQCAAAGVAFWGKQDSGSRPGIPLGGGLDVHQWPSVLQ